MLYIVYTGNTKNLDKEVLGNRFKSSCQYTLLFTADQVVIANNEYDEERGIANDITLELGRIKVCQDYKHLGSIFSLEQTCQRDVKVSQSYGNSKINLKVKIFLYKMIAEAVTNHSSKSKKHRIEDL